MQTSNFSYNMKYITYKGDIMTAIKNEAHEMIENLPEDCTYEDIQYHLYVIEKIKNGMSREKVSHEDAKEKMKQWLMNQFGQLKPQKTSLSIATYIEKDSPFYAKAVVSKFFEKAEALINFSELGRVVPEINEKSIREIFVYSYRLIYKVENNEILIIAVVHGKRLLDNVQ